MWDEWGPYAMRNGNYSISKSKVKGKWIFSLWQITPDKNLGRFGRYKEAQAAHEQLLKVKKDK